MEKCFKGIQGKGAQMGSPVLINSLVVTAALFTSVQAQHS